MEKINKLLNQIYGSNESAMTFYIVLGAIALFFIIVIVVTLVKSKKETQAKTTTPEPKEEVKPEVKEEPKEELPVQEEIKEEPLSETQVFNNILMGKEEPVKEDISIKEMFENNIKNTSDVYLERPAVTTEEPVPEPTPVVEEPVEPKISVPEEAHEEVVETTNEQYDKVMEEVNSMSEYVEEDKPIIPSVEVDDLNSSTLSIKEDYTIEMPKVKPMDIDTYLNRRAEEETSAPEPVHEEPAEEVVKLSNDDIKARLAKLKKEKEEKMNNDGELQDLMKAVGLEDTPAIDDEEKHILGR